MALSDDLNPPESVKEKLGKLADLLERSGIDANDIGKVDKINVWQGFLKDANGEPQLVDMAGVVLSPEWALPPEYPVVQPAKPTIVKPVKNQGTKTDATVTVVLPDPQIGYRRMPDGEMIACHDETAMDVALQITKFVKPQKIVNLGDFIDLPEWSSKFLVLPEFVLTTQPAIDRSHLFLAQQRAVAGDETEIVLLGGNHDDRLPKAVAKNAMAALRLRRANVPNEFPVLSIPYLLRLEELGIQYLGAYPADSFKIAEGGRGQTPLFAIHGFKLDVAKVARSERQSYIQGHIHRIAYHSETYEINRQPETVIGMSCGCLCRIDGVVPSTKGGVDDMGRPVTRYESWQQGLSIVTELEDGTYAIETISIHNGTAMFRGRVFKAGNFE
jgi:hypothetical protein